MLTDSGGFQIVSLSDAKVIEKGVIFKENNEEILLTPEDCIKIQSLLGADIIMHRDDVVNPLENRDRLQEDINRNIRWLNRCFMAHKNNNQLLFLIVQGGLHEDLRKVHIENILKNYIKGYSIWCIDGCENKEDFIKIVRYGINQLPKD